MLKWIRKGDVVEVHSIDRLARNINDLLQIVKIITEERHAEIYFIKENLRFTDDTNNPFNKLTLQIIGSIAEFERNMIKMRQKEGIAIAKNKGVYSKERCKKLSLSKIEELKKDIADKVKVSHICKKYGITKPTFYRYKEQYNSMSFCVSFPSKSLRHISANFIFASKILRCLSSSVWALFI